jgi:DNA-binding response OmpR family regulator
MSYVLILETDHAMRRSVVELFRLEDYEVIEEADSSNAVTLVMGRVPGLILMSEDMPELEGIEPLPLLRRLTVAPIIVVGAGGEAAVVNALLQGADVYLSRPINHQELLIRVRALFRNSNQNGKDQSSQMRYIFKEDDLPNSFRLSLTLIEECLLRCLLERQGEVVAKEELMQRVWGGPIKLENLRLYIHSLRHKLMTESFNILTQNGVGYRLLPMT